MMNQRRLGRTGLKVSEVGLGALELGAMYGIGEDAGQVPDEAEAIGLMQEAIDAGITLFDTAGGYGLSEARIGKFLKVSRKRPVITTKLMVLEGDDGQWLDYATQRPSASIEACVDHQVERSLRNLGVDAIDVMQLHGLPKGELFLRMTAALQRHVDSGNIRFIGASCNGREIPMLAEHGYSTIQISCNMLAQKEFNEGVNLAAEYDFGVLVRSPLALGVLAGRTRHMKGDDGRKKRFAPFLDALEKKLPDGMPISEAALRFLLSSPTISGVLTGTRKGKHIRANAHAGDGAGLPEDVFNWIREAFEQNDVPQWNWSEHREHDWPSDAAESNLALCRSVD